MMLVGLTGNTATGKSTVAKFVQELGLPVVDADEISRKVVAPGTRVWYRLRSTFGDEYFFDDGTLDRKKLGKLIFKDKAKRQELNAVTHPAIRYEIVKCVLKNVVRGNCLIVLDLPLLFESRLERYLSRVIVVSCSLESQLRRLMKRDDCDEEDARNRINAQLPLDYKISRADFVIDNNQDRETTRQQTEQIVKQIRSVHKKRLIKTILALLFISLLIKPAFYVARSL